MKHKVKLPLLLLLSLLWISTLEAQQSFRSGLRLGLNAAQIDGDHMGGYRKAGPVAGLYVHYPFTDKWAWQFEMLYSQKGSKRAFTEAGGGPGDWNLLRLHYVEVPVMIEYTYSKKIRAQAGIGAAYLFGAKLEDLLGLEADADFFDRYEVSATLGATYQVGDKLSLFARHTNSVFSIWKKDTPVFGNYKRYGFYSLVASFGVYYHFVPQY